MSAARKMKVATPLEVISEVKLIPLDLIEVGEQIRKEFDLESILDLAHDIEANGLIQPILVHPTPNNTFELIAGERRLRAVKHLGQTGIPALITKVSADQVLIMQLAENIQRENLSLEEEVVAVAKLYEKLGSLEKVSEVVHRSKAWCSKRYSIALPNNLNWRARELVEDGVTEDLELIKAFSAFVCLGINWDEINAWDKKIRSGNAGREEIRQALKDAKEARKAAEAKKAEKAAKVSHAKPKKEEQEKPWIKWQLYVKHAITHECVMIEEMSSKSEVKFEWIVNDCRKIGLDGEIWKDGVKVKEFFWNEEYLPEEGKTA